MIDIASKSSGVQGATTMGKYAAIGFGYGIVLTVCALVCGMGENTVLLCVVSSPLCLTPDAILALAGTPALWLIIGLLFGRCVKGEGRWGLVLALLTHYVGTVPVVFGIFGIGWFFDLKGQRDIFNLAKAGLVIYAVGQAVLWIGVIRFWTRETSGRCLSCGYDLRGTRLGGITRCPECGNDRSQTLEAA